MDESFDHQIPPSTVFYRVQCTCKYNAPLKFTMIFGKKNYFYFSRLILQELTIASLFIIKAILSLFELPSMYSVHGIFQHHFQCLKMRTIHDKIQ